MLKIHLASLWRGEWSANLVRWRSFWRFLVTPLMEAPCAELLVLTMHLLVCRHTGKALALLAIWHCGLGVVCRASPLEDGGYRSLLPWRQP